MARELLAGSWLNEISGSTERWPDWRVLVHNPRQTTFNDVAAGRVRIPPFDLSPYVESVRYSQNVGFENSNNPSLTRAIFKLRRNPVTGENLRRGLIESGAIVQIYQGDLRIAREDYTLIFTGTFRGRPGDDPGTPATLTQGMEATAMGREERFLNIQATTVALPAGTDVGRIALEVATKAMGLGQDEIRFGAQGFRLQHQSNQIANANCLDALWQLLFTVGKKPAFDAQGRLVAVDVGFDKPAARVFSAGDVTVESRQAQPNDVETNNQVHLEGLSEVLSKAKQSAQLLETLEVVTGFFDDAYKKSIYYSADRTQRAEDTFAAARKKIWFSDHKWTEKDEFHGVLEIDTHYLFDARATIFALYLVSELSIAAIDYTLQADSASGLIGAVVTTFLAATVEALVALRFALKIASQVALAALLWSMNFIGRGTYEIFGEPFEFVYQVLETKAKLPGLTPEEIRTADFRNDFISTMDDLDARARELLRRELVKNQLYQISLMDDPLLEVDDVIELSSGERFYILTVDKTLQRDQKATMTLTCWKIHEDVYAAAQAGAGSGGGTITGYGEIYGEIYGEAL